jgi:hypothetical protein
MTNPSTRSTLIDNEVRVLFFGAGLGEQKYWLICLWVPQRHGQIDLEIHCAMSRVDQKSKKNLKSSQLVEKMAPYESRTEKSGFCNLSLERYATPYFNSLITEKEKHERYL